MRGAVVWLNEESWEILFVKWEIEEGRRRWLTKCRKAFKGWDVLLLYVAKSFKIWSFEANMSYKDPGESHERCQVMCDILSDSLGWRWWSVLFPVKSRIILVQPKPERNPGDWLLIFSMHHSSSVSASQIYLWCDSVLLKSVPCVGRRTIYCAGGEPRLMAHLYGTRWCPFKIFWNFTSRTWKITLTAYPDGVHLSHGYITFYCHTHVF